MSSPPEITDTTTPRPAYGLWALCVIVGGALLLMWADGRVKPLILFPVLIGSVTGLWTLIVNKICHVPLTILSRTLPLLCAVVVTATSLGLAAQRWVTAAKPSNPLAEQLLRQFEQQANSEAAPAPPLWNYLRERYPQSYPTLIVGWLLFELVIAAVSCLIVLKFAKPLATSPPKPPA